MNNNRFFKLTLTLLSFIVLFTACNDSEEDVLSEIPNEISSDEKDFLFNSNAVRSKARSNGIGGPAGVIFRLGTGSFSSKGRSNNNSPLMSIRAMMKGQSQTTFGRTEDSGDSIAIADCLIESFTENEDGSYEYILDFGEGCDVFGETFKGKLTERGSYKEDTFESSTTYEGFGSDYWEINGKYTYGGTWDFVDDVESGEFEWSAEYNYSFDLQETYQDEGETFTVASTGNGKEQSDEQGFTILEQENLFKYSTGESYSSKVEEELFMNFECEEVFTFVSGLESGVYEDEEGKTTYSVNYGGGECDNIILVTENGEEFTIDLDETYDDLGDGTDD